MEDYLDELIKMFNDEIEKYGHSGDRPEWSNDRNLGFREGIRYSRDLLKQQKEEVK